MSGPDMPRNPHHRARWLQLFTRKIPPHQVEGVSKGKIRTDIMFNGRLHSSESVLTLPRVKFLERGE